MCTMAITLNTIVRKYHIKNVKITSHTNVHTMILLYVYVLNLIPKHILNT